MIIAADAAKLGLFEWNVTDDEIIWENDHIYKIFGRNHTDKPIGAKEFLEDYMHPDDRVRIQEEIQITPDNLQFNLECRIRHLVSDDLRWIEIHGEAEFDKNRNLDKVYGVIRDITDKKRRESHAALFSEISKKLTVFAEAEEVFNYVSERLEDHLKISNCLFVDIDEDSNIATICYSYDRRAANRDLRGEYKLSEFMNPGLLDLVRNGTPVCVRDTRNDNRADAERNASLGIRSFITVPFTSKDRWKFLFTIYDKEPRTWREDELDLVRKVTDLLCLKIKHARVEAKLRESESKLRQLFQDAPANISVHEGPDHNIVFSNTLLGKTTGERAVAGKKLRDALPELSGQDIIEKFDWVFKEGKPLHTHQLAARLSGEDKKRYFYQILQPWYMDKTEPAGVMNFSYEITDMVMSGKLLEESERRLQLATKASDLGIFDYNVETESIEWDSVIRKLWGVDEDAEVNYDLFIKGVHPEDRVLTQKAVDHSLDPKGDGRYEVDYRVVNMKTGEIIWVAAIGKAYFKNGSPVKLLGSVRNITEEKMAKAALAKSEERYRNLFNSIDEGFAIVEVLYDEENRPMDFLFVIVNPAFYKHSGIENATGKTSKELNPRVAPFWLELYDEVNRTRKPQTTEKYSEVFERWLALNISPVDEENRVALVFSDITAQKKAELAIIESEKQFRLMADTIPQIIWVTDAEGNVMFLNNQYYQYTGTVPQIQTLSDMAAHIVHPDDASKVLHTFQSAMKSGKQFTIAQRNRRADGEYRRFLNRGVPYFDPESGEITKWYGVSTDIEDLKSAEEKYRLLVESIDEGFCIIKMVYDEEGNASDFIFMEQNPAFAMHFPLPEPIGKGMREMVPDHEQYWFDLYGEVDKSGESARYENFAEALDRYYSVFAFSLGKPESGLVGVLFEDITDKRRAEEMIRNSEERLRLASNAAGLGTYEYDGARDKYIWSPEVYKLYDLNLDEEPKRAFINSRIHPDDRPAFEEMLDDSITSDSVEIRKNIYRIKGEDGSVRWVRDVNRTFYSKDENKVVRVIGIIYDITDTKVAEEALREAARRKDEFLAMLAHELRNPLAPVKSAIELMQDNSDEETDRMARNIIERQVDKLVRLIDDLMDISRISRNKIKLQLKKTDLREAVNVALETADPLIKEKKHAVEVVLPHVPVMINADLDRMIQIITNILTNAAKYTPDGGKIILKLKMQEDRALLSVEDTGVGIADEDKLHIFEMFRQVGNQNSGLGIGLSLVRTLTEMHKGSVSVSSAGRGCGSTFSISLPLVSLQPENHGSKVSEDAGAQPGVKEKLRILVVDDNKDIADLMHMALRIKGFDVEKAFDGTQGLKKAFDFRPQVALLDIGLPDISGYELAKQLKQSFPKILLIAHSGWGQAKDRERAREAGFDHHLIKPAGIQQIVELLK